MPLNEIEEYILQIFRPLINDRHYYGKAQFQFQAGKIVDVDLNRKLKPPKMDGNGRQKR